MKQTINKDLIIKQFTKLQWSKSQHIAKQIIKNKISNQKNLLMYYKPYQKKIGIKYQKYWRIVSNLDNIANKDLPQNLNKQGLFLHEAQASKLYWRGVEMLVMDHVDFGGRGKNTPFNKLLNIGYHYLSKKIEKAIIHVGLWSEIGILHSFRRGNKPLVYDLMEIFRQPFVDKILISYLRNRKYFVDDIDEDIISEYVFEIKQTWNKFTYDHIINLEIQEFKDYLWKENEYIPFKWTWWK